MTNKKTDKLGSTALVLVYIAVFILGYLIVKSFNNQPAYTPTPQAYQNTAKNAFISGCKPAVGNAFSDSQKEQYCGCAYDKLVGLYGLEFYNDSNLVNRIRTEGFNLKETEEITKCVSNV